MGPPEAGPCRSPPGGGGRGGRGESLPEAKGQGPPTPQRYALASPGRGEGRPTAWILAESSGGFKRGKLRAEFFFAGWSHPFIVQHGGLQVTCNLRAFRVFICRMQAFIICSICDACVWALQGWLRQYLCQGDSLSGTAVLSRLQNCVLTGCAISNFLDSDQMSPTKHMSGQHRKPDMR